MEKKYQIGVWINAVLCLPVIAACAICIVKGKYVVGSIVNLAITVLALYYDVAGYKKPHGNLLKQAMLMFGVSLTFYGYHAAAVGRNAIVLMVPVLMMLIAYIAGRLNRKDENKYLMVAVLVGFLYCSFSSIIVSGGALGFATNHAMLYPSVVWITLCGAYFSRFKEHKEAGLED